jgi:hypothetical protein
MIIWFPIIFVVANSLVGVASRADALGQMLVSLGYIAAACLILLLRKPFAFAGAAQL